MLALLFRALLWPFKTASNFLLPSGSYDGLSSIAAEKASRHFIDDLKSLCSPGEREVVDIAFSRTGFAALRQEAAANNSLVFIYIYNPVQREARKFSRRLVGPEMLTFVSQDHIEAIGSSVQTSQGSSLSYQLGATSFPLLAILQPGRGSSDAMKLLFRAEGRSLLMMPPAQLLSLLTATYKQHSTQLIALEARRLEREQANELRRQQDEEYQQALVADQERERQKQEMKNIEEVRIREEEEKKRKETEQEEERLNKAKLLLRSEPASGGTRIRFVLPSGRKLDRRFLESDTVGALKAFLILHFSENDVDIKNIALSTNFPKKRYDDEDQTLVESGLSPQAVLMVQDLDA
eukprot:CAMPEP_0113620502 /NCGR_PEP_ID=MMETSP0017_2-20120614/10451_1 /TAXON_ID=2856 /ORGANISM="Cylindrotheca closterium" /LENGTH=349 /DNA_ID=CAMNT_0000530175 /DNA_START=71 /DNA_END=1120 /DNA_ORIENTATION=+ /assembly_acc=CAM_ASM_000147